MRPLFMRPPAQIAAALLLNTTAWSAQAGVLRGGSALNETETTTTRGQGGSTRAVPEWAQKAPAGAVAVEVVAHRA